MKAKKIIIFLLIGVIVGFIVCFNTSISYINSKKNLPKRPNIILIYLDALRPDHLGCYGYNRDTSPNIDYLARTGVLFKNVFCQAPATYPSVHSTLTSKYASHFFLQRKCLLEKRHLTLAEILRNNGYYTIAISSSPIITKRETYHSLGGFEQGFDVFDMSAYDGKEWNWHFRSPEGVIEKAIGWLNENYRKNFFLFLYIMDPHDKYHSPEPYNRLYDPDYVGKKDVIDGNPSPYGNKILCGIDTDLTDSDIQHLIALYDGEIAYADAQIGRLLEYLRRLNLVNNTLIVLMSDHGEEFFEHGGLRHGYTLYNEVIKAPLIFSYPGFIPQRMIVDNEIVQSIDVVPTILDIVNIDKPKVMQGRSLLPLIEKRNVNWRNYAISEAPFVSAKTIITKKWKYIHHFEIEPVVRYIDGEPFFAHLSDRYKKGKELYNLEEDPMEMNNLYSKKPEIAEKLYFQMMDILPDFERERIEKGKAIEFDQKTVEELKSLGYLQ